MISGPIELVVRRARTDHGLVDLGLAGGRIAAIVPCGPTGSTLVCDAPELNAQSCLVVPGLVETHIHLDKTCIMDRCDPADGSVAEAVRTTALAKRDFTTPDVYERAARTLRKCLCHGTMRMRTHVELDPGIGMRGFDAIMALRQDFAWAIDLQICVFPQEGLLNNPGTDELLVKGLRRGASAIGAVPYCDTDPRGQIDRVFALAREFDVDIDMHLDLGESTEDMQVEYVCDITERFGWGGRVAVGHVTRMAYLPPARFAAVAGRLADAGVAVTVIPSTDLFLMGRAASHAKPRGVVPAAGLRARGVTCSLATNNVLNPFTPYGDGSLIRMANLYANVCHVARGEELAGCLEMVTNDAARLMRLPDYGIAVGNPADLVAIDAPSSASVVAEIASPLWGMKAGRMSFRRPRAELLPP